MSTLTRELPYINAFGTVDISSATDVDSALSLAGLDWEVQTKAIYDEFGNEYPKFRANIKEDTNTLLGIVTDAYTVIQNAEAFDFVNNLSADGFTFDRAGQFRDGKAIWLMGKLPETSILGDKVDNNLVFVNSHDGSQGVKVTLKYLEGDGEWKDWTRVSNILSDGSLGISFNTPEKRTPDPNDPSDVYIGNGCPTAEAGNTEPNIITAMITLTNKYASPIATAILSSKYFRLASHDNTIKGAGAIIVMNVPIPILTLSFSTISDNNSLTKYGFFIS